jgi:hypothetical protein
MTHNPRSRRGPIRYELRLQGHLDEHWSGWFTGLTLTHNRDGTTSLCATLADQAELHGLLAKVRDLGATLLSVTSATRTASCPMDEDIASRTYEAAAESGESGESAESGESGQPGTAIQVDAPPANPRHTHRGDRP